MSTTDPSVTESECIMEDWIVVANFLDLLISFFFFKVDGKLNPTLGTLIASNCIRLRSESLFCYRYNP